MHTRTTSNLSPEIRAALERRERGEPDAPKPAPEARRPLEEQFETLDRFATEIKAGMPEAEVLRLTGIRKPTLRKWRAARGMPTVNVEAEAEDALRLFGGIEHDPLSRASGSPLVGGFDPPQFLVRKHLDYAKFCQYAYHLHRELDEPFDQIAAGLGVRECDIDTAVRLWSAKLKKERR